MISDDVYKNRLYIFNMSITQIKEINISCISFSSEPIFNQPTLTDKMGLSISELGPLCSDGSLTTEQVMAVRWCLFGP